MNNNHYLLDHGGDGIYIKINKGKDMEEDNRSINQQKIDKLKQLLLLTDPMVSGTEVGETQITQWQEFIKEFPDEK